MFNINLMRKFRLRILITLPVFILALLVGHPTQASTYTIDTSHSAVGFSIRHLVSKTKGTFGAFSGTITYDASQPQKGSFTASIDASSIDTNHKRRDGHLQSADFFDVANHPTITFNTTKVETKGALLHVTGDLTMHGVTKSVTIHVEVLGTGTNPRNGKKQIGLAGSLTIKASDFGVNSWEDFETILGDEVEIEIVVEANAG